MNNTKCKTLRRGLAVGCLAWLVLLSSGCSEYSEVERFTTTLEQRHIFGGKSAREVVVVIESNTKGREQAYIMDATSKTWVEPLWVREILLND